MKTSCCHTKNLNKGWNKIFTFFFISFIFILSLNDFSNSNVPHKAFGQDEQAQNAKVLNEVNLRKELELNHIICPEQVFAQILIESGHLNSYLSKKANNLLGMRYPFKRSTSATGIYLPVSNVVINGNQAALKKYKNQNNYAVYNSWQDCIKDYKLWQDKNFKLTERYLVFLGKYYAEDSLYVKKIKSLASKK